MRRFSRAGFKGTHLRTKFQVIRMQSQVTLHLKTIFQIQKSKQLGKLLLHHVLNAYPFTIYNCICIWRRCARQNNSSFQSLRQTPVPETALISCIQRGRPACLYVFQLLLSSITCTKTSFLEVSVSIYFSEYLKCTTWLKFGLKCHLGYLTINLSGKTYKG